MLESSYREPSRYPARPERRKITVCIAAICQEGEDAPRIISCSDTLVSGPLGKSKNMLKTRSMSEQWSLLTAGDSIEIHAMEHLIWEDFGDHYIDGEVITEDLVVAVMRKALAARKREKAEELVQASYAITLDDLFAHGKDWLTPEERREILLKVKSIKVDVELIMAGFAVMDFPTIVQSDSEGRVGVREDFGVIGAGSYLAHSVMMHRQHSSEHPFCRALYIVYEAKRYAEGEISVGDTHTIMCHAPGVKRKNLTLAGNDRLKAIYAEYGPKELADRPNIEVPLTAWQERAADG